ncbi:MAG: nickel-dependent lactate racemase [Spirochaetaceae bacterium]|nr:nickel-dependent lactate racemase [Spirochaetaceae bacterium]
MLINVPYRTGTVALRLPDKAQVIEPNDFAAPGDTKKLVADAVMTPIDVPSLADFLAGTGNVLVIVNDATRPTPTAAVLDSIGDLIESHNAHFLVATGAHRAPTEDEYRLILGSNYDRFRSRTEAHNAKDTESLVNFGSTHGGTPVCLNRRVSEADRILVIGSVEPHYFAGYTGGRKAFLPGVAGYETIQANHKMALDPRAHSLELADNPVNLDMEDALNNIKAPIFSIMTVLDRNQRLAACMAGDIRTSFQKAAELANAVFVVKMLHCADIVISVARSPMDINLYQAQKAIDNGALAVADGGTLILVASCWDGIGDKAYIDLLGGASSPQDALAKIAEGYKLGYHKAAKIAQVASRIKILAYSDLGAAVLGKAFMMKIDSLQDAVDAAIASRGNDASVAVLLDGTLTVPITGGQ